MSLEKNSLFKYTLIVLLCLFDFYKWGFRIFDLICYGMLFFFIASASENFRVVRSQLFVFFLALLYTVFGVSFGGYLPAAGAMLVNVFLYFIFSSEDLYLENKHIRFALLVNIVFFYIQLFVYYGAGHLVNFHEFTDIEPRLMSSIFRPAGLYYEPAIYCLSVFVLLMIILGRKSKLGLIEVCAISSLVLSISFLGFFFAGLVLIWLVKEKKYFLPLTAVVLAILAYQYIDESFVDFVFGRLSDINSDASANERYGSFLTALSFPALIQTAFGMGFGANYEMYGSSAISAAISSIGFFGVGIFMLWLIKSASDRFATLLVMAGVFVSAPVFSYAIFPFWIACLASRRGAR